MKFKALRKKETKEFVEIQKFSGINMVFISELPNPQPMSATIDLMKEIYYGELSDGVNFDFDDFELAEFEMYEANTVGADIRNKLTPPKNLVAMLERYFDENNEIPDETLLIYIKKGMAQTKISIDYIANLF